jgi:sulfur dioxygenase
MIFHQLFEKESSTYTYLLADADSREAVIIDPVIETIERDFKLINDLGLKLKYILDTHVHADHITASGELRQRTGAQIGLSSACGVGCADLSLTDGQELKFGKETIKALHTPGHTSGCITYQVKNFLFTGDTLLVRGCGRTDFQDGSAATLFDSVREKIFSLPEDYTIYPAHDYKGFTSTRIGDEMKLNPRLNLSISKEQFIQIMDNLHLDYPKKIQQAVPANLACGIINAH